MLSKETFFASDIAVFELDGSDEQVQRTLKRCQELAPGMSIEDVIPVPLYRRIEKHFAYVRRVIGGWLHDAKAADEKQRVSGQLAYLQLTNAKCFTLNHRN